MRRFLALDLRCMGFFDSPEAAEKAAAKLNEEGIPAQATSTLTRAEYWRTMFGN